MKILFVADGRSPISRNWMRYFAERGDEVYLASTFACELDFPVKRLEKGTFCWPRAAEEKQTKLRLTPEAFALLTDGIDMHGAKPRGWYERG